MNIKFIDEIAPEHSRTSCSDKILSNCSFDHDDLGGCRRCDLLTAAALPKFPTALRKMWSGSEVQAWIDKNTTMEKKSC